MERQNGPPQRTGLERNGRVEIGESRICRQLQTDAAKGQFRRRSESRNHAACAAYAKMRSIDAGDAAAPGASLSDGN